VEVIRLHLALLQPCLVVEGLQAGAGQGDVAHGIEYGLVVQGDQRVARGACTAQIRVEPASIEDRQREAREHPVGKIGADHVQGRRFRTATEGGRHGQRGPSDGFANRFPNGFPDWYLE